MISREFSLIGSYICMCPKKGEKNTGKPWWARFQRLWASNPSLKPCSKQGEKLLKDDISTNSKPQKNIGSCPRRWNHTIIFQWQDCFSPSLGGNCWVIASAGLPFEAFKVCVDLFIINALCELCTKPEFRQMSNHKKKISIDVVKFSPNQIQAGTTSNCSLCTHFWIWHRI